MNKQVYSTPEVEWVDMLLSTYLQTLSAPGEGIHDGGEGEDGDDPTAKGRDEGWGDLW